MKRILLASTLTFLATFVSADGSPISVEQQFNSLRANAELKVELCPLLIETQLRLAHMGQSASLEEGLACFRNAKNEIHPRFVSTRDALESKPRLQNSLKDWYSSWLVAMEAARPTGAEYPDKYRIRVKELMRPTQQLAERLSLDF